MMGFILERDAAAALALENPVYLIGLRYKHHARHSGYEAFDRYVGTAIPSPVNFRWTTGKWGWRFNRMIASLTRHPWYSFGAHLTEWHALQHMFRQRNCLYHVLYADTDLWLLRRANKLTGNRLVASFHQPTRLLKKLKIMKRVIRRLDAVILVSETQRAFFEELLPPERVFVVPHGVNTDFFRPAGQTCDQPVCITVGSHLRDFNTFKKTTQLVWQVNPKVRFIAVGTRSDKKSYFPKIEDVRVQFLDKISDEMLLQAYQMSTLALFAFEEATANNAMLEAMACGLPVVATNVGGISEYITNCAGILCPPHDPQALATATLQILKDATLQKKMAVASRQRAMALDFRNMAEHMSRVYAKVFQQC